MKFYSENLKSFLDKWPGKKYFGIYRFLPVFFLLGASLEFSMINWQVGEIEHSKGDKPNNIWSRQYTTKYTQKIPSLTMPANVTWGRYLTFVTAAMISMMAGSQTVHVYYKPMSDFDQYIKAEMGHMSK